MEKEIQNAIGRIFEAMQARFAKQYPKLPELEFSVVKGKKYIKLVIGGSAHAFIDAEGNMYKPAGWAAPAKGIRFNIVRDVEKLVEIASYSGGYLYR